ncbi:hypothetical protein TWF730_003643 [Orbilia blumenaviensis]|uniref:BTB domain-containing protein n=1 Tax=Orbilia blumenaviensis TaxID=1796055 RepID=A0AAV9U2Q5_9PEZI
MTSETGTSNQQDEAGAAPKRPKTKSPLSPARSRISHGKGIKTPRPSIGSPGRLPIGPLTSSGGNRRSSFMLPTAASSFRAKGKAEPNIANTSTSFNRSPGQEKVDAHPKAAPAMKPSSPVAEAPGQTAIKKMTTKKARGNTQSTGSVRKPREKSLLKPGVDFPLPNPYPKDIKTPDGRYTLVPGEGRDIGHLITPPEFYCRPLSSVATHDTEIDGENKGPEWFGDLKRIVDELGLEACNAVNSDESASNKNFPVVGPTSTIIGLSENIQSGALVKHGFGDYNSDPKPGHNIVLIVGPQYIGFSLKREVLAGHSEVIDAHLENLGPVKDEMQEIVLSDIDPYGFFHILKVIFTGAYPNPEIAGPKAEALMFDTAQRLRMPRIASDLYHGMLRKIKSDAFDIEVALRFANELFRHGSPREVQDFWHEDAFVRSALRRTSIARLLDKSSEIFEDRTWIVPGFKLGLIGLLSKTNIRV